jgi:hypothetical protein
MSAARVVLAPSEVIRLFVSRVGAWLALSQHIRQATPGLAEASFRLRLYIGMNARKLDSMPEGLSLEPIAPSSSMG